MNTRESVAVSDMCMCVTTGGEGPGDTSLARVGWVGAGLPAPPGSPWAAVHWAAANQGWPVSLSQKELDVSGRETYTPEQSIPKTWPCFSFPRSQDQGTGREAGPSRSLVTVALEACSLNFRINEVPCLGRA